MTRKDYVMLGEIMHNAKKKAKTSEAKTLWSTIVFMLEVSLEAENPRFDSKRFRLKCESGV